jgi:hypothetical protein
VIGQCLSAISVIINSLYSMTATGIHSAYNIDVNNAAVTQAKHTAEFIFTSCGLEKVACPRICRRFIDACSNLAC